VDHSAILGEEAKTNMDNWNGGVQNTLPGGKPYSHEMALNAK
jgi:hypothetical protein